MSAAQHTPLRLVGPIHGHFDILDAQGAVVALGVPPEHAARIVQCVNGWDELSAYAKRLEDAVKAFLEAEILLPALSGPAAVAVIEASALGRAALSRATPADQGEA